MKMVVKIAQYPDGAYRAWCPALPGCVVCAAGREQAQQRIREAVTGYLASLDVALPDEPANMLQEETAAPPA